MIIDGTRPGPRIARRIRRRAAASSRGTGSRGRRSSAAAASGERCDDHRFAGLSPVALIRDAAPGRAARAVHPLAAASRCLRGPLTDLPSTCGGPGMYLAPMLAGGQISRSLAHYGQRLAIPRTPQDWVLGLRPLCLERRATRRSASTTLHPASESSLVPGIPGREPGQATLKGITGRGSDSRRSKMCSTAGRAWADTPR